MEENNKSEFTAEGRKLRPRRPRISEKAYSTSDMSGSENGERKSYGERRSYSSEGRSYNSGERRSYNSEGRNYNSGERRSYNSEGRNYNSGERRSYNSEGRSYNSGERRSYNSEGRSYNSGERRSYNSEGRNYNSGERRSYNSEGRNYNSGERRSYNSEGRSYNSGERKSYNSEGRSYNSGERKSYNSEGRGYNSGKSYNSEGRGYNSGERRSYNSDGKGYNSNKGGYSKYSSDGKGRYGNDKGGFKKNSYGSKHKSNFKKESYKFDDNNTGINKMISRKPLVSESQETAKAYAVSEFKEDVRLNKFIANSGVCSRREADQMIQAGVVTVNGEVVTTLGTKVNVLKDEVRFNGEKLKGEEKVYLVMNKPKGYVTTASDAHADKTVMDLLKGCDYRVFPVGRLDKNTTGVLMFTNDGEIAEKLTHPSYDKKKIYQVILDHPVSQEDFDSILKGITLGDGEIKADELEYIDAEDKRKIGIEIHSGKNRIVRRIFESLNYEVRALDRVYFAGLTKKGLKKGEWRYLTEGETNLLKMGAYL